MLIEFCYFPKTDGKFFENIIYIYFLNKFFYIVINYYMLFWMMNQSSTIYFITLSWKLKCGRNVSVLPELGIFKTHYVLYNIKILLPFFS